MSHHRLPLIAAGLLVAVLAVIGTAEAIIIYDFPIFGVVNGTQVARLTAVLNPPPDQDHPCSVRLAFIDSQSKVIGDPDDSSCRVPQCTPTSSGTRMRAAASDWRSGRR